MYRLTEFINIFLDCFTYEEERERSTQVILLFCQNGVVDDEVKTCAKNILPHFSAAYGKT